MGAEFCVRYYPDSNEKELRKVVNAETAEMAYKSGHSYSGTWASAAPGAQIIDKVFDDGDEAEEYIMDNHQKWDCVMAVKYKLEDKIRWMVGGWCSS